MGISELYVVIAIVFMMITIAYYPTLRLVNNGPLIMFLEVLIIGATWIIVLAMFLFQLAGLIFIGKLFGQK